MVFYMDIDSKPVKNVTFSETVKIGYTYNKEEYDRKSIDSILLLKSKNQISSFQWRQVFVELNQFKIYEMPIHPDSKPNTNLCKIPCLLPSLPQAPKSTPAPLPFTFQIPCSQGLKRT
jgi:hypothetical protein